MHARNKYQMQFSIPIICLIIDLVPFSVFFNHRLRVKVSWKTWIIFWMLVMFQTSSPRMSWIPSSQPWNQWFLILGCSQPKLTYIQLLQNAWEPTPTLLFVWGEKVLNPLSYILAGSWSLLNQVICFEDMLGDPEADRRGSVEMKMGEVKWRRSEVL